MITINITTDHAHIVKVERKEDFIFARMAIRERTYNYRICLALESDCER